MDDSYDDFFIPEGNDDNILTRVHCCSENDVSVCALDVEERNLLSKLIKGLFIFGFTDSFGSKKKKIMACFINFIFSALLITCLVFLVLYFSMNLSIYALVIACLGIALELVVFGVLYYNFKKGLYERHQNVIYCCTCPDKGDEPFHFSYQQVYQAYRLDIKNVKGLKDTKHIPADQIMEHCSGCTDREYSRPIYCCTCPDKGDEPFHFSYHRPKPEYRCNVKQIEGLKDTKHIPADQIMEHCCGSRSLNSESKSELE